MATPRLVRFLHSTHPEMAATRFDIEKFDGIKNFSLWQVRMTVILVQNGLEKVVIEKKFANANQSKWEDLDEKVLFAIQLWLTNNVLENVLMEKTTSTLWLKLEALYMTKSLPRG